MRSLVRTLSVRLVLAAWVSTVSVAVQAQTPERKVQSSPFVGTWVLNVSKSTYEGIPEDQRRNPSTRTLDMYENGVFIESHRNATKSRGQGYFYWVGKPDGPEFPEFSRQGGAVGGNRLTIKTVHSHQWAVTFRNREGKVVITDTWTISPDGKTLTIDRKQTPPNGKPSHAVEVFDNDGWAMPKPRQ
jgi:hypothetical protein